MEEVGSAGRNRLRSLPVLRRPTSSRYEDPEFVLPNCAVTDGHDLIRGNILLGRYFTDNGPLALSIDNVALDFTAYNSIFDGQFIGEYIIEMQVLF